MNFPTSSELQTFPVLSKPVTMDWIQVKTECVNTECDADSDERVNDRYETDDKIYDNYHKYSKDSHEGNGSTGVQFVSVKYEHDSDLTEIDEDEGPERDEKFVDIKYEQDGDSTEIDENDDIRCRPTVDQNEIFAQTDGRENCVKFNERAAVNPKKDRSARRKRGKSIVCAECNKIFVKSWHMKRHMRMVHARDRPFGCPVCYKCFAIESDMNRHVRIVHENERSIACTGCDRRFAKAANMRRHAAEAHIGSDVPRFVCPVSVCGKIFANSRNADIHFELFHGPNRKTKDRTIESSRESNGTISGVTHEFTTAASLKTECVDNFDESHDDKDVAKTVAKYNSDTSNYNSSPNDIQDESTTNDNGSALNSSCASTNNALKLPTECRICFRVFRDNWLMTRHERTHTGERPYKCMQCEKSFSAAASLKEHILTHSNELVCPVCKRKFTRRYYLKNHECDGPIPEGTIPLKRRKPRKPLNLSTIPKPPRRLKENAKGVRRHVCTDCGQRFTRSGNLRIHQVIHTGERPFACEQCDSTFGTSSNLMMHNRQVHTEIRPFSCALCEWKFARSSNLKTHSRLVHGEDCPFQCGQCVKKFPLFLELGRHVKKCHGVKNKPIVGADGDSLPADALDETVKIKIDVDNAIDDDFNGDCSVEKKAVFQCEVCSKTFRKRWGLTSHMQTHSGARPYACTLCDKTFGVSATLQRHMVIHTRELPFSCTECDKTFRRPNDLRIHVMTHTGELPYACSFCGWRFTRAIRLKRHIAKYHSGKIEQPFACAQCDKTFLLLRYLQKHELLHDGERKFACAECNTRYTTSTDLRRHMMKHSGERPYVCNKCDRTFYRPSDLRNHEMTHEGKHPYVCEDCGKGYTRSHDLRIHLRSHSKNPSATAEKCAKRSTIANNLPNGSHESPGSDDNNLDCKLFLSSPSDSRNDRYDCTLCDSSFSVPENLQKHSLLHKQQTFPCKQCNKTYTTLGNLKKHESNHDGERRFPCDQCDKTFAWSSNLKVHRLTHVKKFACDTCENAFSTRSELKRHAKEGHSAEKSIVVHEEYSYVCCECQRGYFDSEQLRTHLVTHWFIDP